MTCLALIDTPEKEHDNEVQTFEQEQLGNGTFTLSSGAFHLTFKIATSKKRPFEGNRIVSLMTGRDNSRDFTGIGILDSRTFRPWGECVRGTGQRRIWKRNPKTNEFLSIQQLSSCVDLLIKHGNHGALNGERCHVSFEAAGRAYSLMVSTLCIKCNRKLTTPQSVEAGIGPECSKMM